MESRIWSTQATASANGWLFQEVAGIYLFLKNIKECESLEFEGKSEDIEIVLTDGSKIYAQAKSVEDINNTSGNSRKLKQALTTLAKCKEPISELIYITNIENPLSSRNMARYQYRTVDFSNFTNDDKERFIQNLQKWKIQDFNTNKFKIISLAFFGNDDNKFKEVKAMIGEFLSNAQCNAGFAEQVRALWIDLFHTNCANRDEKLSKQDIIFPIILIVFNGVDVEDYFTKICSCADYDETIDKYDNIINKLPLDFEFLTKVCGDYAKASANAPDLTRESFVQNNWKNYIDKFEYMDCDTEGCEALCKIVLLKTLLRRKTIRDIKAEAGL